MAHIHFRMLGGFTSIIDGGDPINIAKQQSGLLLAHLLLNPGRTHEREEICTQIWPDDDPEEARHRLRNTIYALRTLLERPPIKRGTLLVGSRDGVSIARDLVATDVEEFESAANSARNAEPAAARIRAIEAATALYGGNLLPGLYSDAILAERDRLADLYRGLLSSLSLAYESEAMQEQAVEAARRALAADPCREESHVRLMQLYSDAGHASDVLQQFRDYERIHLAEFGAPPPDAMRDLAASLQERAAVHRAAVRQRTTATGEVAPSGDTADGANAPRDPPPPSEPAVAQRHSPPSARRRGARLALAAAVALATFAGLLWALRGRIVGNSSRPPASTDEIWRRRYKPQPGEQDSEPTALAIDGWGNVIVAGFVRTPKHDVDYLVLKYNNTGVPIWVYRYNGPSNDVDRARAVAVDNQGNVYVAGDSDNGRGNGKTRLSGLDYATIKIDGGNGRALWAARYNGGGDGEDRPSAIAVDAAGNVYVTGTSWERQDGGKPAFALATVKYDRAGRQLYARRIVPAAGLSFESPALVVSPTGDNLYVAGTEFAHSASEGPRNIILQAYGALDGNHLWDKRIAGRGRSDDHLSRTGLGTDARGDIYLAGVTGSGNTRRRLIAARIAVDGTPVWSRVIPNSRSAMCATLLSFAVDGHGRSTLAGELYSWPADTAGHLLLHLDSEGKTLWQAGDPDTKVAVVERRRTEVSEDPPSFVAVAAGPSNDIFATGGSAQFHPETGLWRSCFSTEKFDEQGKLAWRSLYEGRFASDDDRAVCIGVLPDGSPVVTGQSGSGETSDILTVAYHP